MKTVLYMAMSANGMIARINDDTSWITQDEWNSYSATVRKVGHLIVGHRTYDILTKQPEFAELKDVKLVVVAKQPVDLVSGSHQVAKSPKDALRLCTDAKEVVIAGGGILNAAFLSENLVDEVYIDIEPIFFGQGLPLFNGVDFTQELKLLNVKHISGNEIQLHYQIIK